MHLALFLLTCHLLDELVEDAAELAVAAAVHIDGATVYVARFVRAQEHYCVCHLDRFASSIQRSHWSEGLNTFGEFGLDWTWRNTDHTDARSIQCVGHCFGEHREASLRDTV